jgi:hypothetical protein
VIPIDPYFTSAVKTKSWPRGVKFKNRAKVLKNPDELFKEEAKKQRRAGKSMFVIGGPALTGYRPPRKVWDEKPQ